MKRRAAKPVDDLRPEYDMTELFGGAVQGKYAERHVTGTNLVFIEPEIRKAFRTDQAVNEALRLVLELHKVGARRKPAAP